MKKIFLFVAAMMAALSINAESKTYLWTEFGASGDITAETNVKGLILKAGAGTTVKDGVEKLNQHFTVEAKSASWTNPGDASDVVSFTQRLKPNGKSTADFRQIVIPVVSGAKVEMWAMSASDDNNGRRVALGEAQWDAQSTDHLYASEGLTSKSTLVYLSYTYNGSASSLYLYFPDNGVNIYGIRVSGEGLNVPDYDQGGGEQGGGEQGGGEQNPDLATNGGSWTIDDWSDATVDAPIKADCVMHGLGVMIGLAGDLADSKYPTFKSSQKTFTLPDESTIKLTKKFSSKGGGFEDGASDAIPTKRALYFGVQEASLIKLFCESGGSSDMTIYISDGTNILKQEVVTAADKDKALYLEASYTGAGPATIYIYGSAAFEAYKVEAIVGATDLRDAKAVQGKAVKRMLNGQLVIEKNGKLYNALGAELK